MSKLILVSFADYRYRKSLERLERQTAGFPFDERYVLTERTALTKKVLETVETLALSSWFRVLVLEGFYSERVP